MFVKQLTVSMYIELCNLPKHTAIDTWIIIKKS